MKYRTIAVAACAAALSACQTTPAVPLMPRTVTVDGTAEQFTAKLLERRIGRGYTIKQQTANMIVLDRPANNDFGAMLVYGSRFNGIPNYRLTYQMYGVNPLTVTVSGSMVTNPGSGFENPSDLNNHPSMNEVVQEIHTIGAELKAGT